MELAEKVIPLFVASLLADYGCHDNLLQLIPAESPLFTIPKHVIVDEIVDTIITEKEEMK